MVILIFTCIVFVLGVVLVGKKLHFQNKGSHETGLCLYFK